MAVITSEITDAHGKTHYVGMNSNIEHAARRKGFAIRTVHISGHHIPATVNGLIHHKGELRDGPVLIDGNPADPSVVATIDEHRVFLCELFEIPGPNKPEQSVSLAKVA